jgi:hypothetical protein
MSRRLDLQRLGLLNPEDAEIQRLRLATRVGREKQSSDPLVLALVEEKVGP